jgi:folate-binding protein YgfZ
MNSDWHDFLRQQGAVVEEQDRVLSFAHPEAQARAVIDGDVIADLSHYGLIQVTGHDAAEFLQGQLTNDIRQVNASQTQLSAYCNPKGRMLAILRIAKQDDRYWLRLPATRLNSILDRLRLFVLRADVQLEDVSDRLIRIGVAGERAAAALSELAGPLPETPGDSVDGVLYVVRLPGNRLRFEVISDLERARSLWTGLGDLLPVGHDAWGLLDTLAGMPEVFDPNAEVFVPQMANLELVNGVSFTKGCYTGQEVVARAHYLGKIKRRMYGVRLTEGPRPAPGTPIVQAQEESDSGEVGRVVCAYPHPAGGYRALAVLQTAAVRHAELRVGLPDGPRLEMEPLPYEVPAD